MSIVQMNLPEELAASLARRARMCGRSVDEHLVALLRADLAKSGTTETPGEWRAENRAGIESWNALVAREGLPLAHLAITKSDFGASDEAV